MAPTTEKTGTFSLLNTEVGFYNDIPSSDKFFFGNGHSKGMDALMKWTTFFSPEIHCCGESY